MLINHFQTRTILDPCTPVVQSGHFRLLSGLGSQLLRGAWNWEPQLSASDDSKRSQAGDSLSTLMMCYGEMHNWRCIIARRCCGICSAASSEERTQAEHQELLLPETVLSHVLCML